MKVEDLKRIEELIGMCKDIPAHHLGCALGKVSRYGNYEMAVMLLDLGADVEAKSCKSWYGGGPALGKAIKAKSPTLIKLLLDSGANPNNWKVSGLAPIVLAAKWANPQWLKLYSKLELSLL